MLSTIFHVTLANATMSDKDKFLMNQVSESEEEREQDLREQLRRNIRACNIIYSQLMVEIREFKNYIDQRDNRENNTHQND